MDVEKLNEKMAQAVAAMNEKPLPDTLRGTTSAAVYLTGRFILAVDGSPEGQRFTSAQIRAMFESAVQLYEHGLTVYKGWALRAERTLIQGANTRGLQVHVERAA